MLHPTLNTFLHNYDLIFRSLSAACLPVHNQVDSTKQLVHAYYFNQYKSIGK